MLHGARAELFLLAGQPHEALLAYDAALALPQAGPQRAQLLRLRHDLAGAAPGAALDLPVRPGT